MVSFLAGRAPRVHGSDFSMGFELFGRRALRQGRYKIVWLYEPYGPGRWELFDLAADPLESNDLAASQPAKLAELVRAWDAYAAHAGVVLPTRDIGYALEPAPVESKGRAPEREWRVNSGTADGRRFSPLDQINRENVRQLAPAWVYRTDDMKSAPASTIQCTPIVVDGVMYLTTPGLKLVALQAASGRKLWEFDPFPGERARGTNRGVTYWSDGRERRIFMRRRHYLLRARRRHRQAVASFGKDGRMDLREGLDRDVFSLSVIATSPGIVFEDLLIVGSMVGEGPGPSAPGHVRAYDVRTGKRRWIFHTIPHPGEPGYETWPPDAWKTAGGANAWGGFTLDARARPRLLRHGIRGLRPLGRRPRRREPLRELDRRAARAHGRARLALPGRSPRHLGLRPAVPARAREREARRDARRRGRADDEGRPPVPARPRQRASRSSPSRSARCRAPSCRARRAGRRSPSRRARRPTRGSASPRPRSRTSRPRRATRS